MKEVRINIPEGYTIDEKNSTFECIKFKRVKLPKTWEEFCNSYPIKDGESFIDATGKIYESAERQRSSIGDANVLPNKKYAEAIIALCQLIQLRDCYNEGWQPDWTDSTQSKYCLVIYHNSIASHEGHHTSRLLAFRTEKIRDTFYINFRDIIGKAKILL